MGVRQTAGVTPTADKKNTAVSNILVSTVLPH